MKTEKEKRQAGELYDAAGDPEILADIDACKELCYRYNNLRPSQKTERTDLIRRIFGKTGSAFLVEQPFYCDHGHHIAIGENFYSNVNCVILDEARVTFGDNVLIAPNCGFYTAGHPLDAAQRRTGLEYARPITVGDDVWIGANCVVLPGVTIGSGSVIGAGSVVTRDVPPGVLAAGNPCRVLKEI